MEMALPLYPRSLARGYHHHRCPGLLNNRCACFRLMGSSSYLASRQQPSVDNLNWNLDYATAFIVDFVTKHALKCAQHLRRALAQWMRLAPDPKNLDLLLFDAFSTTNELFFDGKLKNAIHISKASMTTLVTGQTFVAGKRAIRPTIILNEDLFYGRNVDAFSILEILLHHMIHAYFLIACPPPNADQDEDARLKHGKHFDKIMHTIQTVSARSSDGGYLRIDDIGPSFGYQLGYRRHREHGSIFAQQPRTFNGLALTVVSNPEQKKACTLCPRMRRDSPDIQQLNAWFEANCAPLLTAPECTRTGTINTVTDEGRVVEIGRSSAGPSEAYIEFVFGDKSYQCFRSKFDPYITFKTKLQRVIMIPATISEELFMNLMSFLNKGVYGPPTPNNSIMPGLTGPPFILEQLHNGPPYLQTAIQMFKFADAIGFDELRGSALDRLNATPVTHEDPLQLLQTIYDPSLSLSPDADKKSLVHADLRSWVRNWLLRYDSGQPISHHAHILANPNAHFSPPPHLRTTNFWRVWSDHARFHALLSTSKAFEEDVREIMMRLGYALPDPRPVQPQLQFPAHAAVPMPPRLPAGGYGNGHAGVFGPNYMLPMNLDNVVYYPELHPGPALDDLYEGIRYLGL